MESTCMQMLVGWSLEGIISSASATGLLSVLPKKCGPSLCFSHCDVYACSNTGGSLRGKHRLSTFFLYDVDVLPPATLIKPIFPVYALPHFPALFPSLPFHPVSLLPFPKYSPPSPSAIILFTLHLSWKILCPCFICPEELLSFWSISHCYHINESSLTLLNSGILDLCWGSGDGVFLFPIPHTVKSVMIAWD